jgi:hypothetical protein
MALVALALSGCKRETSSAENKPPVNTPESYMNDAEFRARLKAQREARAELKKSRQIVVEKMKAKIDEMVKKHGTNDMAAVRAALRKDPEWRALFKQCSDANTALSENRRKTVRMAGERITSKKDGETTGAANEQKNLK